MFVCRFRCSVNRNLQRSVMLCTHCHVVLIPESGSIELAASKESRIALLNVTNPVVHRTVVS